MGEKITILKALEKIVESIKAWANNKFIKTINGMTPDSNGNVEVKNTGGGFVARPTPPEDTSLLWIDTSDNSSDENTSINTQVTSVNGLTGDVTINTLPSVGVTENGKVLMVVDGKWKAVDITLSVDANGVISI